MSLFSVEIGPPQVAAARIPEQQTAAAFAAIPPAAVSLLTSVLAGLAGISRPIVQIVAVSSTPKMGRVAYHLAAASARHLGPTLLVSRPDSTTADNTGARELSLRMVGLLGGRSSNVTPDGEIVGLYHVTSSRADVRRMPADLKTWRDGERLFQMIVIDCPPLDADPHSLLTALACHGSILSIAAAQTRLEDIQLVKRQLQSSGVKLLGAVLYDAPVIEIGLTLANHRL